MLVSAVSMHGVIPAVKNSPKSNSNYASTAQSHDTFQKSEVSFSANRETLMAMARRAGKTVSGSETKRELQALVSEAVEEHGSLERAYRATRHNEKEAKRLGRGDESSGSSSSSSSSGRDRSSRGGEAEVYESWNTGAYP